MAALSPPVTRKLREGEGGGVGVQSAPDVDKAGENWPLGQFLHLVEPGSAKRPRAHPSQPALPSAELNVPAGQLSQLLFPPLGWCLPLGQNWQ